MISPSWYAVGEIMRTAYEAHAEDDESCRAEAMASGIGAPHVPEGRSATGNDFHYQMVI